MSESALFVLILLAIYLADCVVVVPRDGIALRATFGRRHRIVPGTGLPGTARTGFAWTNPLPPLGEIFVCGPIDGHGAFDDATERLAAFRERTRILRVLCCVLAIVLLAVVPAGALIWGLAATWRPLLAMTLLAHVAVIVAFVKADRIVLAGRGDRVSRLLSIALAPPAAVRAVDVISRDLFAGFHPVVVAAAVCDRHDLRDFAVRTVRKLRYGPQGRVASLRSLADDVERVAAAHLGPPSTWLTAPEPDDPACRSYCPRCLQQYVATSGTCPDCGGIALASF